MGLATGFEVPIGLRVLHILRTERLTISLDIALAIYCILLRVLVAADVRITLRVVLRLRESYFSLLSLQ